MKFKKNLLVVIILLAIQWLNAQTFPLQRFTGSVPSYNVTLVDEASNESLQLTNLITQVKNNGGGTVKIPAGNFELGDIDLQSNVYLDIDKDAYILLESGKNVLFNFGNNGNVSDKISNVKVYCSNCNLNADPYDDERYYTVDYSYVSPGDKAKFAGITNAENFHLSDCKILDNESKISGITMNAIYTGAFDKVNPENSTLRAVFGPNNGDIKNHCIVNSAYGYGLIQAQVAIDVSFEDLYGVGGVTLRFESGGAPTGIGTLVDTEIAVYKGVQAKNINGDACKAVLMLSPHGRIHEDVEVRGISGDGCGFTVKTDKGFIDSEVMIDHDNDENTKKVNSDPTRYKKGVFKSITLSNISSVYRGNKAQIKSKDWKYYPNTIKGGDYTSFKSSIYGGEESDFTEAEIRVKVPSVAPVGYHSLDSKDDSVSTLTGINDSRYEGVNEGDGKFEIEIIDEVVASGYESCFNLLNNILYHEDNSHDYCSNSLSINDIDNLGNSINIIINSTSNKLTINTKKGISIKVISVLGLILKEYNNLQNNDVVDLKELPHGLYILKLNNKEGYVASKKIIIN